MGIIGVAIAGTLQLFVFGMLVYISVQIQPGRGGPARDETAPIPEQECCLYLFVAQDAEEALRGDLQAVSLELLTELKYMRMKRLPSGDQITNVVVHVDEAGVAAQHFREILCAGRAHRLTCSDRDVAPALRDVDGARFSRDCHPFGEAPRPGDYVARLCFSVKGEAASVERLSEALQTGGRVELTDEHETYHVVVDRVV